MIPTRALGPLTEKLALFVRFVTSALHERSPVSLDCRSGSTESARRESIGIVANPFRRFQCLEVRKLPSGWESP